MGNGRKKPITIAVIDSGIDTSNPNIAQKVVKKLGFSLNSEGQIKEYNNPNYNHEHGTVIASIITHICSEVELIDINILNNNLTSNGIVLIYALEQAILFKPDFIHLSLGTTKFKYAVKLMKIIREAKKNNIIIVAASNNEKAISFPSSLKGVVGVKSINTSDISKVGYKGKYLYAAYAATEITEIEKAVSKRVVGTSISAAFITGYLARIKFYESINTSSAVIENLRSKAQIQN